MISPSSATAAAAIRTVRRLMGRRLASSVAPGAAGAAGSAPSGEHGRNLVDGLAREHQRHHKGQEYDGDTRSDLF